MFLKGAGTTGVMNRRTDIATMHESARMNVKVITAKKEQLWFCASKMRARATEKTPALRPGMAATFATAKLHEFVFGTDLNPVPILDAGIGWIDCFGIDI